MTEDSSWGLGWWCWEAARLGFPASKPHTTDPADWAIGPNVASPAGLRPRGLLGPSLEERQERRLEAVGPSLEGPVPELHRLELAENWSSVAAEEQPPEDPRRHLASAVAEINGALH